MKLPQLFLIIVSVVVFNPVWLPAEEEWNCAVYPAEHAQTIDPKTGARLTFITTKESTDENLYFHQRSWSADGSLLFFTSDREGQIEPMAYIEETGEIIRLCRGGEKGLGGFTAGKTGRRLYLYNTVGIVEWNIKLTIDPNATPKASASILERPITEFRDKLEPTGTLNETADAQKLSIILKHREMDEWSIVLVKKEDGMQEIVHEFDYLITHLQCSWETPDLMMYARSDYGVDRVPFMTDEEYAMQEPRARIWFIQPGKEPEPLVYQRPGELITHECWWVGDKLTFCGGFLPDESHVKLVQYPEKEITIIGAGSWWKNGTAPELAKRNWWHAAGSPTGDWVAADTFHGDIVLFNARTTQSRLVTLDHRTYGGGAHPHVGWHPSSDRVVFASNQRGNPDVVVGYLR